MTNHAKLNVLEFAYGYTHTIVYGYLWDEVKHNDNPVKTWAKKVIDQHIKQALEEKTKKELKCN